MTLRLIESFDWLPTGQSAAGYLQFLSQDGYYLYPPGSNPPPLSLAAGALSGNAAFVNGAGPNVQSGPFGYVLPLPGAMSDTGGVIGLRVWRGASSNGNPMFGLFDLIAGQPQITVSFGAYGIVYVWRGMAESGVLLATSEPASFLNDVWFYAELQAVISPTAGSFTVKINAGIPAVETGIVITVPTADTQGSTSTDVDGIIWGTGSGIASNWTFGWDDLYFTDTAGSVNTGFLGNVKAQWCPPNGAGSSTQFTIGGSSPAATNWQSVEDYLLNEAQFVSTSVTGNLDLYTITPLITPGSIFGVQLRSAMRQDDATEIAGQNALKSGATTAFGATYLMNETYAYFRDIWETDPNTGTGWLAANVNAIQIGPKKAA